VTELGRQDTAIFYHFLTARTTLGRSVPWYQGKSARTPASRAPTVTSAHNLPAVVDTPGAPPIPAPTSTPLQLTAHWVGPASNSYFDFILLLLPVFLLWQLLPICITATVNMYDSYCQYVLQLLLICMTVNTDMYDNFCQYIWHLLPIYMALTANIYGSYCQYVWPILPKYMTITANMYGSYCQ